MGILLKGISEAAEHYIFVQFMQFPGVGSLWFLALQLKSWGWREIECVQKQSNLHSASIKNIFQVFYKTFFLSFSNCITVERFQVKKLSCLLLADINGSGGFEKESESGEGSLNVTMLDDEDFFPNTKSK